MRSLFPGGPGVAPMPIGPTPGNTVLVTYGVPGGLGAVGICPPFWLVQARQSTTPIVAFLHSVWHRTKSDTQSVLLLHHLTGVFLGHVVSHVAVHLTPTEQAQPGHGPSLWS